MKTSEISQIYLTRTGSQILLYDLHNVSNMKVCVTFKSVNQLTHHNFAQATSSLDTFLQE